MAKPDDPSQRFSVNDDLFNIRPELAAYGFNVSDNDTAANHYSPTLVVEPTKGIVLMGLGNQYHYRPFDGASGLDTFVYEASSETETATATVTVNINSKPVANRDFIFATPGQSIIIDPLSNDTDIDNDTLSITNVSAVQGSVSINGSQLIYTPNSDALGEDNIVYSITDNFQVSGPTGGIDFSLLPNQDRPVTSTVFVTLAPDIPSNSSTLSEIVVGQSINGDLDGKIVLTTHSTSVRAGQIYHLEHNTDTFDLFYANLTEGQTYTIDLEGEDTGAGSLPDPFLAVYLTPPEPQRITGNGTGAAGSSDNLVAHVNFLASDDDGGTGANARITFTPSSSGIYYIAADSLDSFDPNPDPMDRPEFLSGGFDGSTSPIWNTVKNGTYKLSLSSANVSTITPDAPGDITTTHTIEIGNSTTGIHTEGDLLDWFSTTLTAGNTYRVDLEGSSSAGGSLPDPFLQIHDEIGTLILSDNNSGPNNDARLDFTPSETGTYFLSSVSNLETAFSTGTFRLTLTQINTQPSAADDTSSVRAGETIQINIGLNDTDADNDRLTTSIIDGPNKGNIILKENSDFYDFVTYTANTTSTGTDSFTYRVTDENGASNTATVTITINNANSSITVTGSEVYRFFNTQSGTHFYSKDEFEANSILFNLPHYRLDGPAFKAADPINGPTEDVFRFFNTQSGTHLFTQDTNERDVIIATMDHFNFEGIAYQGHPDAIDGSVPLYRFFNTQTGGHFYTVNEGEKDNLIATASDVYNFENIAYHVYRPTDVEIAPIQSDPVTTTGNTLSLETDLGIF